MLKVTLLLLAALVSNTLASPCPYADLAKRDVTPFQGLTATQQMDNAWSKISAAAGRSQSWPAFATVRLLAADVKPSLQFVSDEMPNGRDKLIHSVGVVAKASFVAQPGSPYTGLFQGSDKAILRLSLATDPSGGRGETTPGGGIKFFRDNMPSANFVFMHNTVAQSTANFFERDFSTHVKPSSDIGQQLLLNKFETAGTSWAGVVGTSDVASFTEKGARVPTPNYPFQLVFRPSTDVLNKLRGARWTKDNVNQILTTIPTNTTLWTVWAAPAPSTPFTQIGSLVSSSAFTTSVYGDAGLFFRHQKFEEDLAQRPEWTRAPSCRDGRSCVNCNTERTCVFA
ncbi:hypothetical protein HDV05_003472 [Chytridiales sp. JEL 0842]|nr:hypothetical protein HDV05_003472 [Chytridiales sp. JEL 0842]